jgi:SPP1 family predicted phage head-tail adaptor
MRAGRLKDRVELQAATESRDGYGDSSKVWAAMGTRWAGIEPLHGKEFFASEQLNSETTTKIAMRYDSLTKSLTSKHRVKDKATGLIYNIVAPPINVRNQNKDIELMCKVVE